MVDEQCEMKYDYENMHKKLKDMTSKIIYNGLTKRIFDANENFV